VQVISFLCTDLIKVQVHENPNIEERDVFKYRPLGGDIGVMDTEDVSSWNVPETGRLRSIRLYKSNRC